MCFSQTAIIWRILEVILEATEEKRIKSVRGATFVLADKDMRVWVMSAQGSSPFNPRLAHFFESFWVQGTNDRHLHCEKKKYDIEMCLFHKKY